MTATSAMPAMSARSGRGAASWLLRHERAIYGLCLVALIAPIWLFTYFPSTDGPVHLDIAEILRDYDLPSAALYRQYFVLNPSIEPNVTAHYLLAELGRVMDLLTAEKLLLTAIILALGVGARQAVRAVAPASAPFAFLFLPTAYSYFFNEGYYNFCLGLGLYLLVLGFWYGGRDRLTLPRTAGLALLGLVVVWTHLIAFGMLVLSIGVIVTVETALSRPADAAGRRRLALSYLRRAAALVLIFLPALLFALSFFDRHGISDSPAMDQDVLRRLKHLATMSFLFTHSPWEVAILAPVLALTVFLGLRALWAAAARRRPSAGEAFLATAAVFAVLYLALPVTTKGVEITQRFLPYILFALLLWAASRPPGARLAATTIALVAAVVVVSTGYRFVIFDRYERLIDEYVSAADHVEPGSTLLALHFWRQEMPLRGERITWRSDPLRHVSSHIARATDGVDLRSYMMWIGYFPVRYREEVDPYRHLGHDLEQVPPRLDLTPPGGRPAVDYVLAWAYPNEDLPAAEVAAVMTQVEARYDLVYVSPDRGLVRLYRRRAGE